MQCLPKVLRQFGLGRLVSHPRVLLPAARLSHLAKQGASNPLLYSTPGPTLSAVNLFPLSPTSDNVHVSSEPEKPQIPDFDVDPDVRVHGGSLTKPQLSRAAAEAIRLCAPHALKDSYLVYNSVRITKYTCARDENGKLLNRPIPKLKGLRTSIESFLPVAVKFSDSVNPRLSGHALVHALIRMGLTRKAQALVEQMENDGITLRIRTLETLVKSRLPYGLDYLRETFPAFRGSFAPVSGEVDALYLKGSSIRDESTRLTFKLITNVRFLRKMKTFMRFLILSCIVNGEIGVAALVYGWHVRECNEQATANESTQSPPSKTTRTRLPDYSALYSNERNATPCQKSLSSICRMADEALSSPTIVSSRCQSSVEADGVYVHPLSLPPEPPDPPDPPLKPRPPGQDARLASLQALAHLAVLLDSRTLSNHNTSVLIRSLYNVPKTDLEVWVFDSDTKEPTRVKAYDYFHSVLDRLIQNLPASEPTRSSRRKGNWLPPLDLSSYNTLLHYSLRHRRSPELATKILRHMMREREKVLEPDVVTYNILLRNASLLRRNDVVQHVLERMQDRMKGLPFPSNSPSSKEVGSSAISSPSSTLVAGHFSLPESPTTIVSFTPDAFTISSYVQHLVGIGRPLDVTYVLHVLFPSLKIRPPAVHNEELELFVETLARSFDANGVEDATHKSSLITIQSSNAALPGLRKGYREKRRERRKRAVDRAVKLGPRFFVSCLNALVKAGKIGLSQNIFYLAKKAERASLVGDFHHNFGSKKRRYPGWVLPISAYTIMLKAYSIQARKGLIRRRVSLGLGERRQAPARVIYSSRYRLRSSQFQHRLQSALNNGRSRHSALSVIQSQALYQNMYSSARKMYHGIRSAWKRREWKRAEAMSSDRVDFSTIPFNRPRHKDSQLPVPDARFFNVALDIFSRRPMMQRRRAFGSSSHYRRHLKRVERRYAYDGITSRCWTPMLQTIRDDMEALGYEVPLGLRYLFVGYESRLEAEGMTVRRSDPDLQPFAVPSPSSHRSASRKTSKHQLETVKTRGSLIPRQQVREYKRKRRRPVRTPKQK